MNDIKNLGQKTMKTTTAYSGSYIPLFTGTAQEFTASVTKEKQTQMSLVDYPGYKRPIENIEVGDLIEYDRTKASEFPVYKVEEIHGHGADENQRVVVMKRVTPALSEKEQNERTVFNARFLLGCKVADLYFPARATLSTVDLVVSNRQNVNVQGGYNSQK